VTDPKPKLQIETLDDMKRVLIIAKGGDPDSIQAIANFMDLKSNTERSFFPDKKVTICIGQLNGFGKVFYPNDDWNPFDLVADAVTVSFMGYKGFKSNQFVDMTRQQPNLKDLQAIPEENRGFVNRILGRSETE